MARKKSSNDAGKKSKGGEEETAKEGTDSSVMPKIEAKAVTELEAENLASEAETLASEDEGPEDVLLVRGRDRALEQKRLEAMAIKRVKHSTKEKRRLKAEMFKKQKEAKLFKTLTKFPEGDLDKALSKMAEKKQTKERKQKKRKRRAVSKPPIATQVGSVKVVVTPTTDMEVGTNSVGYERACEFLREQLYGDHQKRTSAMSQFTRKTPKRPAYDFVSSR